MLAKKNALPKAGQITVVMYFGLLRSRTPIYPTVDRKSSAINRNIKRMLFCIPRMNRVARVDYVDWHVGVVLSYGLQKGVQETNENILT